MAAITGGIASSPISTACPPTSPSKTAIALAMSIAITAGPESSCRLARLGGGVISSRSLRGMRQS